MEESSIILALFGTFAVLLILGAPITVSLAGAALVSYLILDIDPQGFVQIAFTSVGSFPLMALPSFILAGALMEAAGISKRLVEVAESFAGPFTGGLGVATVAASLFFGAISGSGPATTAAVGMLMIPAMIKRNYDKSYACAITASSGGLGIIIPPSIPMVIFGISAMSMNPEVELIEKFGQGAFGIVSIPKLFIAGIIPGMVMSVSLLIMNFIISKKRGYKGVSEGWSFATIKTSLKDGIWSIIAPFLILGGIYSGLFTPTESAIVAVFYSLFIGLFVHREMSFRSILRSFRTTTWLSGRILLVLFTATIFGRLLVENRIPAEIASSLLSFTDSIYVVWFFIITFLLFIGMFMETLAAIMILVPVLLPIMFTFGVDPTHLGVVIICALSVGFYTPPLGENIFVASGISGLSVEEIIKAIWPFIITAVIALFVIAFFPQLTLFLPSLFGY